MITQFKIYENLSKPQVGDYVVCQDLDRSLPRQTLEFISNTIGELIKYKKGTLFPYIIYYKDSPQNNHFQYHNQRMMQLKEILFWSKNKEDCEDYLAAKKYNL